MYCEIHNTGFIKVSETFLNNRCPMCEIMRLRAKLELERVNTAVLNAGIEGLKADLAKERESLEQVTRQLWQAMAMLGYSMPSSTFDDRPNPFKNGIADALREELERMKNSRIEANKVHLYRYDELKNQKEYYGILFGKFQILEKELANCREKLEQMTKERG